MKVIKCTSQYLADVGRFYDETVLYLTQHINYPKWMYKYYPTYASAAEATAQGTQYLCLEGDQVVGAFVLNTDPQGNYNAAHWSKQIADGNYFVLHAFATHPNYYRKGVASFMLNFCLQEAKRCNMQAIRLDVVPQNTPAKAFYQKHGFAFVAELDLDREFEDIPTFCLYEYNF